MQLGVAVPSGDSAESLVATAYVAEQLGLDSISTGESYGDATVTVLAWLGATTTSIRLDAATMQIPGPDARHDARIP
jgi:alkanesulfonate monooxygenase SsuD/methylene tetrahydromethanopterin reductase-like flavin-dependent oxidoreductase (luciferase family)